MLYLIKRHDVLKKCSDFFKEKHCT